MTSLERLLGQALNIRTRTRSQASIDAAKRERSFYSKAKRLAAKKGVELQVDRMGFGGTTIKWVLEADDFEQKSGITRDEFHERWPDERAQDEWETIYKFLHWTLVEGKPLSEYR